MNFSISIIVLLLLLLCPPSPLLKNNSIDISCSECRIEHHAPGLMESVSACSGSHFSYSNLIFFFLHGEDLDWFSAEFWTQEWGFVMSRNEFSWCWEGNPPSDFTIQSLGSLMMSAKDQNNATHGINQQITSQLLAAQILFGVRSLAEIIFALNPARWSTGLMSLM